MNHGDGRIPIVVELGSIELVAGSHAVEFFEMADGSHYSAIYRYAQYGERFVRILESVEQDMPPRTPQCSRYDDQCRVPMMENGYYSPTLEAAQRRTEWAEVNA